MIRGQVHNCLHEVMSSIILIYIKNKWKSGLTYLIVKWPYVRFKTELSLFQAFLSQQTSYGKLFVLEYCPVLILLSHIIHNIIDNNIAHIVSLIPYWYSQYNSSVLFFSFLLVVIIHFFFNSKKKIYVHCILQAEFTFF